MPGTCRWFLVRHGETEWNRAGRAQGHSDPPLNDTGRVQVRRVAARLAGTGFEAAYASDLRRAVETARAIVPGPVPPLLTLTELREKNFGEWEGLTYREVSDRYPDLYDRLFLDEPTFAPPGGESDRDFLRRAERAVELIKHRTPGRDGNVLVVAHGGTLRAVIVTLLGMKSAAMWRFRLANAGVSIVTVFPDGYATLDLLNDTGRLGADFHA